MAASQGSPPSAAGKKLTEVAKMKIRPKSGSEPPRGKAAAEIHGHVLPAGVRPLVEYLQVAADALDVDVQREHALESGDEHEQRDERAESDGDDRRRADGQRRPADQGGRHQDHPSGAALSDGRAHRLVLGEPVVVGDTSRGLRGFRPVAFAAGPGPRPRARIPGRGSRPPGEERTSWLGRASENYGQKSSQWMSKRSRPGSRTSLILAARRETGTFFIWLWWYSSCMLQPGRREKLHEIVAIYEIMDCRVTVLVARSRHCCYTVFVPIHYNG